MLALAAATVAVAALVGVAPVAQAATTTQSFFATGGEQTFTVPAGTTSLTVTAVGGDGTANIGTAGLGAQVSAATLGVTPGQILYVEVGQHGSAGGFNGGGISSVGTGGGATDLRTLSRDQIGSLATRLLVVPGGGSASYMSAGNWESPGTDYCPGSGGGAGTASAGGAGGNACAGGAPGSDGDFGTGGNGGGTVGGAGGGGWYGGGGGGELGGGGGGSRYVSASVTDTPTFTDGDGTPRVVLTYEVDAPPVAVDDTKTLTEDASATTIDVLVNDTDSDGGPKTIASKTNGTHGTVAVTNAGADLTYTPDANYCNTQAGGSADTFTYTLDGGSTGTVAVTVTCVDDLPSVALTATALAYTENDPPTAVDDAATITDADDTNVESGEVKLTNPQAGDELSYATTNGIAATVNVAKDTVTFSVTGTKANYEAALRAVRFRNTSDNPSTTARTARFKVNDGDGDSNLPTRAINVSAVNDVPAVVLTGTPLAYTENDVATAVDGAAAITDPDDANVESGEVKLTNPQAGDELSYATTNGIAGTVNVAKDTVTFSVTGTKANYEAALRAVRFRNTSDNPSTTARTARFKVNDGDGDSNLPTRTIDVTATNDAPDLGTGAGDGYSFRLKWGTSGSADGQMVSPWGVELDANGNVYVVEHGGNRIQKFSANGTFISKFGSAGSGNGQFSGPIDIAFDAVGNYYVTEWTGNRVQKFAADGTFITKWGTGGAGNGQFQQPFGVAVGPDGNVYVTDALNNRVQKFSPTGAFIAKWGTTGAGNGQFQRPYGIEIDPSGNVYVGEAEGARVQKFTSTGAFLAKWGSLGSGDSQLNWTADLALDAGGSLLVADYSNNRVQKIGPDGTFLARFGSSGSADGRLSAPGGVAVDAAGNVYVSETGNNRISKFAVGPEPLAYTEGQAATAVLPTLTAVDLDHANLSSATVSIAAGFAAGEDVLGFTTQSGITGSYAPATGVMTLSGSATVAQYRDALRAVTYRNTSIAPSTAPRTISFRASDGVGQGTTASREVRVTAVNSTPTVTTTSSPLAYTSGQAATAVDQNVAVDDIDNANLASAKVQITSGLITSQDVLALGSNAGGIAGSYNASTGLLTLTGTASLANYQTALRSVTYRNTSATATTATRTVRFTVNDGAVDGFGTRNIAVTNTPVAPTLTTASYANAYYENAAAIVVDNTVFVADPDSASMASAQVSISANFAGAQDLLAFTNQNGIVGSYDPATGILTLTGVATTANYQAALRSVTYRDTSDDPTVATRTVSFTINDGGLTSAVKTRSITVQAVNDPPVVTVSAGAMAYTEGDGSVVVDAGVEVTDVDSPKLTRVEVQEVGDFAGGQDTLLGSTATGLTLYANRNILTWIGDGSFETYRTVMRGVAFRNVSDTPSTGPRTVTFSAYDGVAFGRATRSITLTAVNDAPTASANSYSVGETSTLSVAAPGVLANDTDVDSSTLSVGEVGGLSANVGVQQTTGKGAKVTINADGALSYDPNGMFAALNAGQVATDSITYKASDGTASSALVTVTFTINGVGSAPVAVKDAYSVGENGTLGKPAPGVLQNDSGANLTVSHVGGSAANVGVEQTTAKGAKVTISADGALAYDPNGRFEALDSGETGTDSVTYAAFDGVQSAGTATVTFTIEGANDAPAATDDAYAVGEDTPLKRPASGVLGNDTDIDVEAISVGEVGGSDANVGVDVTTAKGAKLRLSPDGSFTYDPNGTFEGLDAGETDTDSVTYKATDGTAPSATATITFTVSGANDAPAAAGDAFSVGEDGTLSEPAAGVLSNDSDVDDEPITVGAVGGFAVKVGVQQTTAKGAKVTIAADGSVSYDPNSRFEALDSGETATDSIAYQASDASVASASAKVTFTINGANDAPSAEPEAYHVSEKGTLSLPAGELLANDFDVDVEPLTVGEVAGDSANVGLELRTDKDAKFTINADGSFSYDPDNRFLSLDTGETETDTITYRATDGDASSDPVTVTVTVHGANDDPTAIPDTYSVGENGTLVVSADGLALNDGDVDQELLHVSELEGSPANVGVEQTTSKGATVTVTATGSVNYDPNGQFEGLDSGETGTDSFTYRISDEDAESNLGTATINIIGANDAPVAAADVLSAGEDTVLSQAAPGVLANDDDVDVEALTVSAFAGDPELVGVEQTTAKGAKVTVEPDGAVRYDPNGRFEGLDSGETDTDSFQYTASDGSVDSEPVTATITIHGANDAPSGTDDAYSVGENGTLAQPAPGVLANDDDIDIESVTVGEVDGSTANVGNEQTTAKGAKVTIDAAGAVAYDPNGQFEQLDSGELGTDSISYKAADGTTTGNTTTVTFTVEGANDAPVAVDDALSVAENDVLSIDAPGLLDNDTDADVEALTIDRMSGDPDSVGVVQITPKGAKVTVNANGSVTYDPDNRFEGLDTGQTETDSVSYRVTDGAATSNTATITFTINGTNDVPVVTTTATALSFDQGDPAKAVDSGLTITDDDTNLAGAEVRITDPDAGDELSYATTAGVAGVVNVAKDTVTLSGAHPVADYRDALRAVTFFNGANNPSGDDRHVRFTVNDGDVDSQPATRTIDVTLDTTAPDSVITSGPTGDTPSDDPSFEFAATAANPGGKLRCRLDGPGAATATYADCTSPKAYVNLDDGAYVFRAYAVDAAGNADATPDTRTFNVDATAPATTDNVPTTVRGSAVTVTLTANDGSGSGIDKTYYTKGASPADPTTASTVYDQANKPTLADGELIRYFSTDKAGNAESVQSSPAAKVDTTAPVTTSNVPATVQGSAVVVTLTAIDSGGSDVFKTYYTKGATPADPTTASTVYDQANKPTLAEGESIKYFSTDLVGNPESVKSSAAAKVDTTAPVTTNNVPATVQATAVVVTLTAIDSGGSAVDKTYYTTGTSPADPTTASTVYDQANKPTLADGELIKYFSVDQVGNAESVKSSPRAKVSSNAPITTDDVPATFQRNDVTVTLTPTDASGAGVDKTYYTKGTGPAAPTLASALYDPANKPTLADGELIKYFSTDLAGNAESVKTSPAAKVDKTAPVTTDDVPATAQASAVAVTLSATDAGGSAVAKTYYTKGATPADPTATSAVYDPATRPTLANGELIRYFSADNAGNQEAVKSSAPAKVTAAAPVKPTGKPNVIRGTPGNDTITGTAGDDVIYCGAGDDVVNAGAGNDVIDCGAGNDRVNAGAGNDLVFGRSGNDRLAGSSGTDSLIGAEGDDRLSGGTGKDRLRGSQGRDELYGQAGNDRLSGGTGADRLSGAAGHDRLSGDEGNDRLWGGEGNDRLYGRTGDDRASGGPGDDRLSGGAGADRLLGGAGSDRLIGGPGIDVLDGGPGVDTETQ